MTQATEAVSTAGARDRASPPSNASRQLIDRLRRLRPPEWWRRRRHAPLRLRWVILILSVLATESLLVWFTIRSQNDQRQRRTIEASIAVAAQLQRVLIDNLEELQAVTWQERDPARWHATATGLLSEHRQLLRIEKRDADVSLIDAVDSPFSPALFKTPPRIALLRETIDACRDAESTRIPSYSRSFFAPIGRGLGVEVLDLCIPARPAGKKAGFVVATLGLGKLLAAAMPERISRAYEASFLVGDGTGTRLARAGAGRGNPSFRAERLVSVPGLTLQLRLESPEGFERLELNTESVLVILLNLSGLAIVLLSLWIFRKGARLREHQERFQTAARLSTVGEVASLISHEINQPLLAVTMYADAALQMANDGNPADIQQLLERVVGEVARMGRVVKSVQAFVGRGEAVRESATAGELIESVLPLIELHARKSGTRVLVELEPAPVSVVCDRVLIEQVLLNLARNAMQAMERSTDGRSRKLRIASRVQSNERVRITVTDTGPGIPPDVAEEIDTPFKKSRSDGMGLGLSLCRTVVEKHGGALGFRNVSQPGRSGPPYLGTEFFFTLPRAGTSSESTHETSEARAR